MSKKPGNPQDNDPEFWDLEQKFIDLANTSVDTSDLGKVGAAMLYAAARFNTFAIAATALDRKEFIEDADDTMDYLSKQFRHMLGDNLRDFKDNYKIYIKSTDEDNA